MLKLLLLCQLRQILNWIDSGKPFLDGLHSSELRVHLGRGIDTVDGVKLLLRHARGDDFGYLIPLTPLWVDFDLFLGIGKGLDLWLRVGCSDRRVCDVLEAPAALLQAVVVLRLAHRE